MADLDPLRVILIPKMLGAAVAVEGASCLGGLGVELTCVQGTILLLFSPVESVVDKDGGTGAGAGVESRMARSGVSGVSSRVAAQSKRGSSVAMMMSEEEDWLLEEEPGGLLLLVLLRLRARVVAWAVAVIGVMMLVELLGRGWGCCCTSGWGSGSL